LKDWGKSRNENAKKYLKVNRGFKDAVWIIKA